MGLSLGQFNAHFATSTIGTQMTLKQHRATQIFKICAISGFFCEISVPRRRSLSQTSKIIDRRADYGSHIGSVPSVATWRAAPVVADHTQISGCGNGVPKATR